MPNVCLIYSNTIRLIKTREHVPVWEIARYSANPEINEEPVYYNAFYSAEYFIIGRTLYLTFERFTYWQDVCDDDNSEFKYPYEYLQDVDVKYQAPDGTWFDPPNYPFSVAMHNAVSHVLTDMIPVNYEKFDFIQLSLPSCWRDFKTKYPIGNKLDNNGNPVLLNGEPIKCYRYQYEVFSCNQEETVCCSTLYEAYYNSQYALYHVGMWKNHTPLPEFPDYYYKCSSVTGDWCQSICNNVLFWPSNVEMHEDGWSDTEDPYKIWISHRFYHTQRKNTNANESYNDNIIAYPNPTDNSSEITINSKINGKVKIRLLNSTGSIINEYILSKNEYEISTNIDLNVYSSGLYIINVFINDEYIGSNKILLNK